jgi:uncharacterized protein YlbG (UPF0298 family)
MRARNIKPGFFKNEQLPDCDPLARLLFIGLWCMADRRGRMEDRPKKIKIEILPCDNCDVEALLDQLQRCGFICRYEVNGRRYIQVVNFEKHQHPHHKEPDSALPAPDADAMLAPSEPPAPTPPDSLIPDSLIAESSPEGDDARGHKRKAPRVAIHSGLREIHRHREELMQRAMQRTVHMLHNLPKYLHSLLRKLHKSEENMHRLSCVRHPDVPYKILASFIPLKPTANAGSFLL